MGLRLEVYNNNFVNLITDFNLAFDSNEFCNTDSITEAMKHFDLYIDEFTHHLKRKDPNQKVVDELAIDADTIDEFKDQLEAITDFLTDEQALECMLLFSDWNNTKIYEANDRIRYNGMLYKCLMGHTAQEGWEPDVAPSLWAKMLIDPENEGP
jgi:hypothetical protein